MTIFFSSCSFLSFTSDARSEPKKKNEETRTPIDETRSDDDDDVDERTRPDQNDPGYEDDSLFACLLALLCFFASLLYLPWGLILLAFFFYLLLAM
jgi:hypothetical protein